MWPAATWSIVEAEHWRNYISPNNFLYGHMLAHKDGAGPPVRKLVIAIDEFLAGEIVMQFDTPDPSEIEEACGVVAHKR